jgi:membrane-associated phospholipid phosphatase
MQISSQRYDGSDDSPVSADDIQCVLGNISIGHTLNTHETLILLACKAFRFFIPNASMGIAWAVVGIFVLADLVWLPFSKLRIAPNTGEEIANLTVVLAAMLFVRPLLLLIVHLLVRFGLAGDSSRIIDFIREFARGFALLVLAVFFLESLHFGVLFEYLATSANLPLFDPSLDAIDRAMGFDWSSFFAQVNTHPGVNAVLVFAYSSITPVFLGVIVILCFQRDARRLSEYLAVLAVSLLCTFAIGSLVPAAGAFTQHTSVGDVSVRWSFNNTFQSLRDAANPIFDFSKSEGLVTFPSFHAVLAIITTYALRNLRVVYLLCLVILNALVIVSTLTEGGHYLIDVIGGVLVAGASIVFIAAVESRSRTISEFVPFAMPLHRTDT